MVDAAGAMDGTRWDWTCLHCDMNLSVWGENLRRRDKERAKKLLVGLNIVVLILYSFPSVREVEGHNIVPPRVRHYHSLAKLLL